MPLPKGLQQRWP